MAAPLFHCGTKKLQRRKILKGASQLFASSTKKVERYFCGPRLLSTFDPEGDTFRYVRENLTDVQLEAADGSNAQLIVKKKIVSVASK